MAYYKPITCKSAMNRINSRYLPFHWDLNIYRGCAHRCRYCYALYTHDYMEDNRFFDTIYIKQNVADRLAAELAKPQWKREVVNIGGITDSYQPIEADMQLMPEILKLLIQHKTPCIISTKSDLILRDFDLLDQLSRITYVNVAATITTTDEALRQKLEPGGAPSSRRFAMLKAFAPTKVHTGLHAMPIIPLLSDSDENLESLFAGGADAKVDYVLPGLLNLKGKTRDHFLEFFHTEFPEKMDAFLTFYGRGGLDKAYKKSFYQKLSKINAKYGLTMGHRLPQSLLQPVDDGQQLSLF